VKLRVSLAALTAAVAIAGCGGDATEEHTPAAPAAGGKDLFAKNCSSCHTLAAAGAAGKVGPNLDQLRPGPDLVTSQVINGGGGMPAFKGKLSDAQINQIADYVSENAGK